MIDWLTMKVHEFERRLQALENPTQQSQPTDEPTVETDPDRVGVPPGFRDPYAPALEPAPMQTEAAREGTVVPDDPTRDDDAA